MVAGQSPELPSKRSADVLSTMPEPETTEEKAGQDEHSSARKKVKREHDHSDGVEDCREPSPGLEGVVGGHDGQEGLKWSARDTGRPLIQNGGKVNIDQGGWGRLPKEVLNCILDHAIADIPVAEALTERWGAEPSSGSFLRGLTARIWLTELRETCSGWKEAIDDHRFWLTFYTRYDNTVNPLAPPERRSTREIVSSNFKVCSSYWMIVCTICRFNRPGRGIRILRKAADVVYINTIGVVGMCDLHGFVCSGCGTESVPERNCPPGHEGSSVQDALERETFDDGALMEPDSYLCRACRIDSLRYHLRHYLSVSARSGPVRGLRNNLLTLPECQDYIVRGLDISSRTAFRSLNWAFLSAALGQTSEELLSIACKLQYLEDWSRYTFTMFPRQGLDKEWEGYFKLQTAFLPLRKATARDDAMYRYQAEKAWFLSKDTLYGEDIEPDEVDCFEDLNERYHSMLLQSCHQHLALARVRAGFWVWPGTEVNLLSVLPPSPVVATGTRFALDDGTSMDDQADVDGRLGDPLLPVFAQLAKTARHPFASQTHVRTQRALLPYSRSNGLSGSSFPVPLTAASDPGQRQCFDSTETAMHYEHVKKDDDDVILPGVHLTRALDDAFHLAMRNILGPALRRLVEVVWVENGRGKIIQNIELDREMEGWGIEKVLEGLKRKEVWVEAGGDFVDDDASSGDVPMQRAASVHAKQQRQDEVKVASPKIELVADTTTYDPSHGITETDIETEQDVHDDGDPSGTAVNTQEDVITDISSPIQPPASQHPSRLIRAVNEPARSDPDISITAVLSVEQDTGSGVNDTHQSGTTTPSESTMEDPVPVTPITSHMTEHEQDQAQIQVKGAPQDARAGADHNVSRGDEIEEDLSVEMPRGQAKATQAEGADKVGALARLQALGATADAAVAMPRHADSKTHPGVSTASTPRRSPAVDSPIPPRASQMPTAAGATRGAQVSATATDTPAEVDKSHENDDYDGDLLSDYTDYDSDEDMLNKEFTLDFDANDKPILTRKRPSSHLTPDHFADSNDTFNSRTPEESDIVKGGSSRDLEGEDARYGRLICAIKDVPYIPYLPPLPETVNGSGGHGGEDAEMEEDDNDDHEAAGRKKVDVRSVLVSDLVLALFKQARAPLRECECRICFRAKAGQ